MDTLRAERVVGVVVAVVVVDYESVAHAVAIAVGRKEWVETIGSAGVAVRTGVVGVECWPTCWMEAVRVT